MNGAQIDERLDLLNDLRRAGYGEVDIKLTENGHDFVVGLEAMRRLRGELTLDGFRAEGEAAATVPVTMPDRLLHAPELERAVAAAPEDLPVCPTALQGLKGKAVDRALKSMVDPAETERVRRDLLRAGQPPTDEQVQQTQAVGVMTGVLTFGISVGLGIAAVQAGGAR
jgi:hypothetical protein